MLWIDWLNGTAASARGKLQPRCNKGEGQLIRITNLGLKSVHALWVVVLACAASYANASPCDRMKLGLSSKQTANLSTAVAGQLNSPSARIAHSYRLGNWYLFYVNTPLANDNFVFYRGDPATHRYVALWSGGGRSPQSELRTWARANAPGIPEALAKCFASTAAGQR
jgi:hypothetical protein